ncbi:DJ-1/PfpI family protein [Shinella zoogloeoides]|uniref:Glutamine amidotransferase n=1 Tax=Shinella zoogloeoides TaxID=352475 RepID=A0A6N8TCN5_SHIZO|nr:DJ-1/PfpI family protein [Shinella zoogloeoides]MXO00195.1 glutamine amidotransferase [Shinella zoogloeoides]UEX82522.1 DJ-1/PfpI family protein [Shinella zoogloeoides]
MTKRLAIVLTDGYADWECGLLTATARHHCKATTVVLTPGGADVTSLGGLAVASAGRAEDARPEDFDVLVLCGGTIWQSAAPPDLSAPVGRFLAAGKPVAGICDATLALGRMGVLDTRAHTGNHADELPQIVPAYRGHAHYRDQPQAVCDQGVITASGAAPVTFAREILIAIGLGSPELLDYLALYGNEHRPARG